MLHVSFAIYLHNHGINIAEFSGEIVDNAAMSANYVKRITRQLLHQFHSHINNWLLTQPRYKTDKGHSYLLI